MEVGSGSRVDSIKVRRCSDCRIRNMIISQVMYGEVWGDRHGGSGGSVSSFSLNPGASIIIVQGRADSAVDSIEFISSDGGVFGPFGGFGFLLPT